MYIEEVVNGVCININGINELYNKIEVLENDINKSRLTSADSNVLSVAMCKLNKDKNELSSVMGAREDNEYEDMVEYYNEKVAAGYVKLAKNYNIVLDLYFVATDKERESLLMYLE